MIEEKSAGAVVFHRNTQIEYLLLFSNYWGFPKGHIEKGEDERAAAIREIREESGLQVTLVEGFRQVDKYFFRHKGELVRKEAVFFLAEATSAESRLSHEHSAMVWLSFEQALARLNYEGGRNVLRQAHEFLTHGSKQ
ncbi:MAG: NUDIX domain-containing protein [Chloroflexi bacterium]|nr:NUDIX domain-containing protein [Chloroflexota bacterium]